MECIEERFRPKLRYRKAYPAARIAPRKVGGVRDLYCFEFNFNLKLNIVKTVTMLEFRRNAQSILRRIAKGERLVLSHRGRPVARLEPMAGNTADLSTDPFLSIADRATPSPKGRTRHQDIDRILYGGT
jgi:antitoxin (DNA-binding transcriptional repressor) of toxin-antitoxin stability system